jgi:hypothetical protein
VLTVPPRWQIVQQIPKEYGSRTNETRSHSLIEERSDETMQNDHVMCTIHCIYAKAAMQYCVKLHKISLRLQDGFT